MNQKEYMRIWESPITYDGLAKIKCDCKHSMWNHAVEDGKQNCLDCSCKEFNEVDEFVSLVVKTRKLKLKTTKGLKTNGKV